MSPKLSIKIWFLIAGESVIFAKLGLVNPPFLNIGNLLQVWNLLIWQPNQELYIQPTGALLDVVLNALDGRHQHQDGPHRPGWLDPRLYPRCDYHINDTLFGSSIQTFESRCSGAMLLGSQPPTVPDYQRLRFWVSDLDMNLSLVRLIAPLPP